MRAVTILSLLLVSAGAQAAEEVLFNGKDLTGWTFYRDYSPNNTGTGSVDDMAKVVDGVIELNPSARGALVTKKNYQNYKLHAEFKWGDPKGGNSGIFVRLHDHLVSDIAIQPGRYMIQVQRNPERSATGELWVLGTYSESRLTTKPELSNAPYGPGKGHLRQHLKYKDAEKPAGEWNTIEAELQGPTIKVWLNGELVNEGTNIVDVPSRIGLEPEGAPISFRNIRVSTLPDSPPTAASRGGGGGGGRGGARGGAGASGAGNAGQ